MPALAYHIAVLCYLFDEAGRVLLLRRRKPPNQDLYSPVGGKLDRAVGESPTACAVREIREETGQVTTAVDLHLTGIVSESGYDDQAHWLMFLYELTRPVTVEPIECREGLLEWHEPQAIRRLPIPQTDRQVLWPLFWKYRSRLFTTHIDCHGGRLRWRLEQPAIDAATVQSD